MEIKVVRSKQEIVDYYKSSNKWDSFGFARGDLLDDLDFAHAQPLLKDGVTEEEFNESIDKRPVLERMTSYMPFAWKKANGCRGLSARRSMLHYRNWLWLVGEDQLADSMLSYEHYGKENLIRVCEFLGLDYKQWDNGERTN